MLVFNMEAEIEIFGKTTQITGIRITTSMCMSIPLSIRIRIGTSDSGTKSLAQAFLIVLTYAVRAHTIYRISTSKSPVANSLSCQGFLDRANPASPSTLCTPRASAAT